jgi:ABC-type phosphate transport system substrate-binding protein
MGQLMRLVKHVATATAFLALSLNCNPVAADVVAVVSSRSSVTALNPNQVADIFLGKADRFPDGGQAVPIDQPEGSAARDAFYAKFTGKSAAQMKAHWSKIIFTGRGQPPKEVAGGMETRKLVARDPKAIGYIDESLVDGSVRVLLSP